MTTVAGNAFNVDLGRTLAISFYPATARIKQDETLRFYLEIKNRSNKKQNLHFHIEELGGHPLNRVYYYEVFKVGQAYRIYVQPHWREWVLSEPIGGYVKEIELRPGETYREEFTWSLQDMKMGWLKKFFFREEGDYRVSMDLNFDRRYRPHTPNWDQVNHVEFGFHVE